MLTGRGSRKEVWGDTEGFGMPEERAWTVLFFVVAFGIAVAGIEVFGEG